MTINTECPFTAAQKQCERYAAQWEHFADAYRDLPEISDMCIRKVTFWQGEALRYFNLARQGG